MRFVAARMLWIFPGTYLPRWLSRRVRERDPSPPWQVPTLIGWTGMRGAVSLAAALALPFSARYGAFERRDLIIFLTFSTILVTLIAQGLSLPWVIRRLGFGTEDETAREDADGRLAAAEAAIARINDLAGEDWVREDTAERLRAIYEYRRNRFSARLDDDVDEGALEERSLDYQRLRREVLEAERRRIVELRDEGTIGDETMRRIERDLDLEDARLEI